MESAPTSSHRDSNNNFSVTAAFSSAGDNDVAAPLPRISSATTPRPKTPKQKYKQKTMTTQQIPYAQAFLNSLRQENAMPFRYHGVDLNDTVRTNYPFIYRINDGVSNNTILQQVCEDRGWVEFKDPVRLTQRERDIHDDVGWNMWWSYNFYQSSPFRTLKSWQYTNHNPRAFQFCNKSYLTSFLRKMLHEYGEAFDFAPKSFIMPDDYVRFVGEHTRRKHPDCSECRNVITMPATDLLSNPIPGSTPHKRPKETKTPVWISKPVGKSQGKGIYLTTDVSIIANESRSVVQEYISRPHLIGGYKWDIRIYVCVASTDPLVIYLYREGLCRFATEKYDLGNLTANFSHLTNASLNKLGPDYPTEKEIVGSGCKWSLRQLRKYFKDCGISDWYLWQKIMSMVVLTVVGEALRSGYSYPANKNCFDFFGFDILVDENLRPWLLEVNYSPGLGGDCEVDDMVKKPMLHELFDLLKFPDCSDGPNSSNNVAMKETYQSKLVYKIDKYLRSPMPVENKAKPIDCSCKARLQEATSIYTQDLVTELIARYSKNPYFKMTKSMQAILTKKVEGKKKNLARKYTNPSEPKPQIIKVSTPEENRNDSIDITSKSDDEGPMSNYQIDGQYSAGDSEASRPSSAKQINDPDKAYGMYLYLQRQDWMNPPKTSGDWALVYPCKAYPYKSPYRSSLSDLRGIAKTVENYLQISRFVFKTYAKQSDGYYRDKIKALCRWDIDLWAPPEEPM